MPQLPHGYWDVCKRPGDVIMLAKGRAPKTYYRKQILEDGYLLEDHRGLPIALEQQIRVELGTGHQHAARRKTAIRACWRTEWGPLNLLHLPPNLLFKCLPEEGLVPSWEKE